MMNLKDIIINGNQCPHCLTTLIFNGVVIDTCPVCGKPIEWK